MPIQYPIPQGLNETWAGAQDWLKNLIGNIFDPNKQTQPPAVQGMQAPPQSLPELMAQALMIGQGTPKEAYESGIMGMGPMPLGIEGKPLWQVPLSDYIAKRTEKYGIRPAIKVGEEIFPGNYGQIHFQINDTLPKGWWDKPTESGWIDQTGNWLNRGQAEKIISTIDKTPESLRSIWAGHSSYIGKKARDEHSEAVMRALDEGLPIPKNVLDEYGIKLRK